MMHTLEKIRNNYRIKLKGRLYYIKAIDFSKREVLIDIDQINDPVAKELRCLWFSFDKISLVQYDNPE